MRTTKLVRKNSTSIMFKNEESPLTLTFVYALPKRAPVPYIRTTNSLLENFLN